jgi:hypothetical protein
MAEGGLSSQPLGGVRATTENGVRVARGEAGMLLAPWVRLEALDMTGRWHT